MDPAQWKVYTTCPKSDPPRRDQEAPVTAGAMTPRRSPGRTGVPTTRSTSSRAIA